VTRAQLAAAIVLGMALVTTATGAPAASARRDLEAAHAAQVEAARHYRESLEALLPLRENALRRAAAELARRRDLLARQLIAPAELESAARAVDVARTDLESTLAAMREADAVAAEAAAARELAALPPAAPGQVSTSSTLIRHDGRVGAWSLTDVAAIETFFAVRFHRPLPISARGQTAVHDRLGFDHHEALDVAVHPDSPEGRALMDYLRSRSIPFLAFRAAQPGVATGAHVHIGRPSPPAG